MQTTESETHYFIGAKNPRTGNLHWFFYSEVTDRPVTDWRAFNYATKFDTKERAKTALRTARAIYGLSDLVVDLFIREIQVTTMVKEHWTDIHESLLEP